MGPPPNDDLDLQIIWLAACERYGRNECFPYWERVLLSYCIPNWVEYERERRICAQLQPPVRLIDNITKTAAGCYIRSEIWACLLPGNLSWRHVMPAKMPS